MLTNELICVIILSLQVEKDKKEIQSNMEKEGKRLYGRVIYGDFFGAEVYKINSDRFIVVKNSDILDGGLASRAVIKEISKETVSFRAILRFDCDEIATREYSCKTIIFEVKDFPRFNDVKIIFKDGEECIIRPYFDVCVDEIIDITSTSESEGDLLI